MHQRNPFPYDCITDEASVQFLLRQLLHPVVRCVLVRLLINIPDFHIYDLALEPEEIRLELRCDMRLTIAEFLPAVKLEKPSEQVMTSNFTMSLGDNSTC